MAYDFSDALSSMARERLETSAIGEMIKLTAENQAVSFTAGEPSADLLPLSALSAAFSGVFDDASRLGYYWSDLGHVDLRQWICGWMNEDGLLPDWAGADSIVMTCGSQEGINLIAEALIDPGSLVVVERPTYMETLLSFRKQGATCIGVDIDENGVIPSALDELLSRRRVRFVYSIPNFQNPSGYTASADRRRAILEVLRRHDVPLIEDDPYHHLSYAGSPPATYIRTAGDDARVIYLGSFSKIIAPGIRVGWMVVPPSLITKIAQLRVNSCLGLPIFVQEGLLRMLTAINVREHIWQLTSAYEKRRDGMLRALDEHLAPLGLIYNRPAGGFFIWGNLPGIADMSLFAHRAVQRQRVAIVPGSVFYVPGEGDESAMRISFAKTSPEVAWEGAMRLAEAVRSARS